MRFKERLRAGATHGLLLALAVSSCEGGGTFSASPARLRVAISGAPGGSFLSVWGDAQRRRALLVGGLVGVDPSLAPGGAAGRLVEYRRPGQFTTRCTVDRVLWWVSGVDDGVGGVEVWAVGDRAGVVRMRGDRCEPADVGQALSVGAPTFWGVLARAPGDVWIVGGSPRPDGPRGVLLHGDGVTWRQERLPAAAALENLYKIAADGETLYVVGSGGLVLRRDPRDGAWLQVRLDARADDNRLFTVSCMAGTCFAVGGSANALIVRSDDAGWSAFEIPGTSLLEDLPGLNGVWVRAPDDVFAVGVNGAVLHTDGARVSITSPPATQATLHAVGGFDDVVLAVGGEIGVAAPSQRGVILIRGESEPTITLDGRAYGTMAGLRRSGGGAGQ